MAPSAILVKVEVRRGELSTSLIAGDCKRAENVGIVEVYERLIIRYTNESMATVIKVNLTISICKGRIFGRGGAKECATIINIEACTRKRSGHSLRRKNETAISASDSCLDESGTVMVTACHVKDRSGYGVSEYSCGIGRNFVKSEVNLNGVCYKESVAVVVILSSRTIISAGSSGDTTVLEYNLIRGADEDLRLGCILNDLKMSATKVDGELLVDDDRGVEGYRIKLFVNVDGSACGSIIDCLNKILVVADLVTNYHSNSGIGYLAADLNDSAFGFLGAVCGVSEDDADLSFGSSATSLKGYIIKSSRLQIGGAVAENYGAGFRSADRPG